MGGCGTHLKPQHSGGRVSEFEDSLIYKVSFRTAKAVQRNLETALREARERLTR